MFVNYFFQVGMFTNFIFKFFANQPLNVGVISLVVYKSEKGVEFLFVIQ